MAKLTVIDSVCVPGSSARVNEDAVGAGGTAAFVIDGATGLGESVIAGPGHSDAAWLAEFARLHFIEMLENGQPSADIVAETNALASQLVTFATRERDIKRWQMPIAGFQMARLLGDALHIEGLGDCVAFVEAGDGATIRLSPMEDFNRQEVETAREAIARTGALTTTGALPGGETTLSIERQLRARFNTPGGPVWTLGTEPDAAQHIVSHMLPVEQPMKVLLCTDGFSALVDKYHAHDARNLLECAQKDGLTAMIAALRHIETVTDPDGLAFPRMKQSDDASAMLLTIDA